MKRKIPAWCLLPLVFVLSSCERQPEEPVVTSAPTDESRPAAVDPAAIGGAKISGIVTFAGTIPSPAIVKMGGNPECSLHAKGVTNAGDVLINDGKVQNAFVYIKEGLRMEEPYVIPLEPVVIDQKQCMYSPRVAGAQAGQPIQLLNSDPTLHNIHAFTKVNKAFNVGLPMTGSKVVKKFDRGEVMVSLKCDLHSWMQGWIGIIPHPYFAVTDAEGRFELKNVPPGNYTLEIWHERLGTFTQTVQAADFPLELSLNFPS